MKKVKINEFEYEIIKNINDCFSLDEIQDKVTDYFDDFDYIFGDFAYDKVRLKGFYEDGDKAKSINNIESLDDYIKDFCSYGCRYFLLKKIK